MISLVCLMKVFVFHANKVLLNLMIIVILVLLIVSSVRLKILVMFAKMGLSLFPTKNIVHPLQAVEVPITIMDLITLTAEVSDHSKALQASNLLKAHREPQLQQIQIQPQRQLQPQLQPQPQPKQQQQQ